MFRLVLKLALAAAVVWAVWTFVPLRGRTLAQRWDAAPSAPAFLEGAWAEVRAAVAGTPARAPRPDRLRPTEGHTEADRRAVERIVSERLAERR